MNILIGLNHNNNNNQADVKPRLVLREERMDERGQVSARLAWSLDGGHKEEDQMRTFSVYMAVNASDQFVDYFGKNCGDSTRIEQRMLLL